jgi:hypothetical protein
MIQKKHRQPMLCPLCRKGRVIDAAQTDASRLKLYGPRQSEKANLFSKCPKCGEQIGIAFV